MCLAHAGTKHILCCSPSWAPIQTNLGLPRFGLAMSLCVLPSRGLRPRLRQGPGYDVCGKAIEGQWPRRRLRRRSRSVVARQVVRPPVMRSPGPRGVGSLHGSRADMCHSRPGRKQMRYAQRMSVFSEGKSRLSWAEGRNSTVFSRRFARQHRR